MAPRGATPDAAFIIESLRTRVRFENDGTGTREMSLSVKVLDEQAVRQWGQITLAYQSDTEDLAVPVAFFGGATELLGDGAGQEEESGEPEQLPHIPRSPRRRRRAGEPRSFDLGCVAGIGVSP